jgi:hypothetical protein
MIASRTNSNLVEVHSCKKRLSASNSAIARKLKAESAIGCAKKRTLSIAMIVRSVQYVRQTYSTIAETKSIAAKLAPHQRHALAYVTNLTVFGNSTYAL